jgi:hypothetical protein
MSLLETAADNPTVNYFQGSGDQEGTITRRYCYSCFGLTRGLRLATVAAQHSSADSRLP